MKKSLIIFSLINLCFSFTAGAFEIKGKAEVNSVVEAVLIDPHGTVRKKTITPSDTNYSLNVDATSPCFWMIYLTYKDSEGNKRQAYSPIYVNPDKSNLSVDIISDGDLLTIDSSDNNQKIIDSYSDFLKNTLSKKLNEENVLEILNSLTDTANQFGEASDSEIVTEYLNLWGLSSRKSTEMIASNLLRRQRKSMPEGFEPYPVIIDNLVKNPAVIYFPGFFSDIIRSKATGNNIVEQIYNLRNNLGESDLTNLLETKMLESYVSSQKGKDNSEGVIAVLEELATNNPKYQDWINEIAGYKSYTQPGDAIPDDIFFDSEGNEVKLSDFKGKYLFIDFWASWCTYCIRELPALHKIQNDFSDNDIMFVGISLDADKDSWKKAMEKYNLEDNQLIVSSPEFAEKMELSAIPRYMLYDPEGKLIEASAPRPSNYEKLAGLFRGLPPID